MHTISANLESNTSSDDICLLTHDDSSRGLRFSVVANGRIALKPHLHRLEIDRKWKRQEMILISQIENK